MQSFHSKGDEPKECRFCVFTADTKYEVNLHSKEAHKENDKRFKCEICIFATAAIQYYRDLLAAHLNLYEWKCDICAFRFNTKLLLKTHVKGVHEENKVKECTQCEYIAVKNSKLENHMQKVHNTSRVNDQVCNICDHATYSRSRLNQHMYHMHIQIKAKDRVCKECNYSGSSPESLEIHN